MILTATGHRPDKLGGYGNDRAFRNTVTLATVTLERLQPDKVIAGMAQGWDTAVAGAALLLGIPLVAALPFEGYWKRWEGAAKQRLLLMLKLAAEVVVVSPGGYTPKKMQDRNEWMIDRGDYLITLFNGSQGGTRNCLLYRRDHKPDMPVENLWDTWLTFDELL